MHNVKNSAFSTVSADNGATIVVAADNFPAAPFYLTESAGLETVEVTAKSGTTLTVTRAVYGTQTNLAGKTVELRMMAENIMELQVGTTKQYVVPMNNRTLDRANIQKAIDSGDEVYLGAGTFLLSADGLSSPTKLLEIQRGGKFVGAGNATNLLVAADVGAGVDIIQVHPPTGIRAMDLGSFKINSVSGTPGRHAIHFNLTDASDFGIFEGYFHDIEVGDYTGATLGGYDIYLTNPTLHDGFFSCQFERIRTCNGWYFNRIGDSVYFDTIHLYSGNSGNHSGITVAGSVDGANILTLNKINGWGSGCLLNISGHKVHISNTNLEMQRNPLGDAATVIVNGDSSGKCELASIENCQIRTMTGTNAHALMLTNCDRATIRANNLAAVDAGSCKDLYVAASCTNTVITSPNICAYGGKSVLDSSAIYIGNANI